MLKSNRQEVLIDQSPAHETCLQPSKEHLISHIYWNEGIFCSDGSSMSLCLSLT